MLIKRQEYFFAALFTLLAIVTVAQFIPIFVALLIVVFAIVLSCYQYCLQRNNTLGFYGCWLFAIVLAMAVGLYRPVGFSYPLIFSANQLYEGGLPFSLYVNTAKLFAGYIIICFLLPANNPAAVYVHSHFKQYALSLVLALLILIVAYEILNLQIHLKELNYILMFGVVNLLVTCIAEEAFMRLLLQAQLQQFIAEKVKQGFWLEFIPLLAVTFIFALTHFTHDVNTMLTFTLAGFVYGLIYSLTKNLCACIAVHFAVNIIHFAFLTYPLA